MADRAPHLHSVEQREETYTNSQVGAVDTDLCFSEVRWAFEAGRRALVLIGRDPAVATEALDQLVDRLRESRRVARLPGSMLRPHELALGLFAAIDAQRREVTPTARDGEGALPSQRAAVPIVVIIEGCDGLLPSTAAWLASLIRVSEISLQLVLVGRYETVLRRALPEGLREHKPILLPERFHTPRLGLDGAPSPTQHATPLPEAPAAAPADHRPEPAPGPDQPRGDVSEDAIEGPADPPALAPVIDLRPRVVVRPKDPAVALATAPPAVSPAGRFESLPDRNRLRQAMALVGITLLVLGLGVWGLLALAPLRPDEPIRRTVTREAQSLDVEASTSRADAFPVDDRGLTSAPRQEQRPPGSPIVAYEPATQQIRISARGEPLDRLLTLIAWQTGLLFESEVDLSKRVSVDRSGLTIEAMLQELLQDYHVIAFGPSGRTAASGPETRTIWVLMERSPVAPVAAAVDTLLAGGDPSRMEEAAGALERQGSTSVGYALVGALQRAQASETEASKPIGPIARRIRDTLCEAWSTTAVGPQATSLRCE